MDLSRSFGANAEVNAYVRRLNSLFGGDIGAVWAGRMTCCLEGIYASLGGRANGRQALTDAIFLTTGTNVGTGNAAITLRGRAVELGGTTAPTWAVDGVTLDGVSQFLRVVNLPDTRTGTVVFVMSGSFTQQVDSSAIFALSNSAGIDGSTALSMNWAGTKAAGSSALGYTRQGGVATNTTSIVGGVGFLGVSINEAAHHCYAITNDNAASPTLNFYVDGNLSFTDNAGNTQATSTCTTLVFGGRLFSGGIIDFSRATVQAILIFNRVLTAAELSGVNRAIQYIGPEDFICAVEGDSTSYFNNTPANNPAPGSEWSAQLRTALGGVSSRWKVQNWAFNGDTTTNILATWPNQIQQFRPGGRYRDGACVLWAGINDILAASTAAAIFSRLASCYALARENGFRVIAGTLAPGSGYTGPQNVERLALNSLLRANSSLYDNLIEADVLFPDPAGSYFFDGFHLNPTGYATLAQAVRRILRI